MGKDGKEALILPSVVTITKTKEKKMFKFIEEIKQIIHDIADSGTTEPDADLHKKLVDHIQPLDQLVIQAQGQFADSHQAAIALADLCATSTDDVKTALNDLTAKLSSLGATLTQEANFIGQHPPITGQDNSAAGGEKTAETEVQGKVDSDVGTTGEAEKSDGAASEDDKKADAGADEKSAAAS